MKLHNLVFAVLIFASLLYAADKQTITGRVTDSEGAAIAHARVLIHWDSSGSMVGLTDNAGVKDDLIVFTDTDGKYSLHVPPGFYDVFVTSTAFTPVAAKVRIKTAETKMFNAAMKADPLVTSELGH